MPLRCLLALVGGLVLAAAFEPIGWAWLMPPAIAALVLSVRGLRPRRAWLPSLLFGITFTYAVMVWMRSVGTDAWIGMCGVEAAFFVPLGLGLSWSLRLRAWPVWTALWWVGMTAGLPAILSQLGGYDLTYGSLAGVVVMLLFFYLIGLGLVFGAHLNAALAEPPEAGLEQMSEGTTEATAA